MLLGFCLGRKAPLSVGAYILWMAAGSRDRSGLRVFERSHLDSRHHSHDRFSCLQNVSILLNCCEALPTAFTPPALCPKPAPTVGIASASTPASAPTFISSYSRVVAAPFACRGVRGNGDPFI